MHLYQLNSILSKWTKGLGNIFGRLNLHLISNKSISLQDIS